MGIGTQMVSDLTAERKGVCRFALRSSRFGAMLTVFLLQDQTSPQSPGGTLKVGVNPGIILPFGI